MHVPPGEGRGRRAGKYCQVCLEGSLQHEGSIWELCVRAAGSQLSVCSRVPEAMRGGAVCLGEEWRLKPNAGS